MAVQENTMMKNGDLEAGEHGRLYPSMTENPQLRWSFIRKLRFRFKIFDQEIEMNLFFRMFQAPCVVVWPTTNARAKGGTDLDME
ncbi:hypothetical protein LOK49_LG15G00033 [Camellia lanceoleosa]|uniref:Uncharacterized protein n=1 Tax=Camellia lanceoleosa TaxID=1840588 RepID=A0ACC0F693_9ERIC|nr:hypothetical protein LOK49_LG15G00033 [Camellia lanceoleosa]